MTVDPTVVPGLLLLAAELLALAGVGFVVARVALRLTDDLMALAQGMVIGPALWGLIVNFVLHVVPGRAGALVGWVVLLGLAASLVWRAPQTVRPRLRTVTGVAAVALAVFLVALAARQLLQIPDQDIHLGLAAFAQAGGWPLVIPWAPDQPLIYHYGVDLLIGLLAPPVGPDLPFTTELLGAYVWTGFVLVVATALLKRAGWVGLLTLTPLLLTAGAWTLVGFIIPPPDILQIPVPTGLPAAGLRASMASLYWPEVSLQWQTEFEAAPPNIWKPPFVLAYALTVIVLTWAVGNRRRSWPAVLTLAALIGFLGLLGEEVALVVLALWGGLEAVRVFPWPRLATVHARLRLPWFRPTPEASFTFSVQLPDGDQRTCALDGTREREGLSARWEAILRAAAGPALAVLLLAVGGGPITTLLAGSSVTGTSLGWLEDPGSRRPFGTLLTGGLGGVGVLGLGVVPVAAAALLLAWRQRLVVALTAGSGVFMLAAVVLQHPAFQFDVTRMDGYARNFALLALLVALGSRLAALDPRWRYAAAALIVVLVAWPTVAAPVRMLGLEARHGIELANAQPGPTGRDPEFDSDLYYIGMGRYTVEYPVSGSVAAYIRSHTPVDARIFSPHPHDMTATTGRPNASGFVGLFHLFPITGPAFDDAKRWLEPAAVRRLGVAYVHATEGWIAGLPERARRWLEDPQLFEPLIRSDSDAFYRIRPAFLELEMSPTPESFEALRQAVPASATVYLPEGINRLLSIRPASALVHTRLLGKVDPSGIHLLTDIPTEPLGGQTPDLLVMSGRLAPSVLAPEAREPVWWNDETAIYSVSGTMRPIVPPPSRPFSVRLSGVQVEVERIRFTATFIDRASRQWTGQDWLILAVDNTPWPLPTEFEADEHTLVPTVWFAGVVAPRDGMTTQEYEFDARAERLAVWEADGGFVALPSSEGRLVPGAYVLAARLRLDYLEAAIIPVLKIVVSEAGGVVYTVYEDDLSVPVNPCPSRLKDSESCRQAAEAGAMVLP